MTAFIRNFLVGSYAKLKEENTPIFIGDLRFYNKLIEPNVRNTTYTFTISYNDLNHAIDDVVPFLCVRNIYLLFDSLVLRSDIQKITYFGHKIHPIVCASDVYGGNSIYRLNLTGDPIAWYNEAQKYVQVEVVASQRPRLFIEYTQCMDHVLFKNNIVAKRCEGWMDVPVGRSMTHVPDTQNIHRYNMNMYGKDKEATQVVVGCLVSSSKLNVDVIRFIDGNGTILYELPGYIARFIYEKNKIMYDVNTTDNSSYYLVDFDMLSKAKFNDGERDTLPYGIDINTMARLGKRLIIEVITNDACPSPDIVIVLAVQRHKLPVFF